jgi:hypothetical protein
MTPESSHLSTIAGLALCTAKLIAFGLYQFDINILDPEYDLISGERLYGLVGRAHHQLPM